MIEPFVSCDQQTQEQSVALPPEQDLLPFPLTMCLQDILLQNITLIDCSSGDLAIKDLIYNIFVASELIDNCMKTAYEHHGMFVTGFSKSLHINLWLTVAFAPWISSSFSCISMSISFTEHYT